ncbi:hypothetical protein KM043_004001 [Ampulex compressa]|nr:hypothetical protein KM043_004001 [Ampulex compressa]
MRVERILFLSLYVLPVIFAGDEKNESVFVPTREWQVVKKGIPISEGLHVRHNLQTGVTEAKLMDDTEDEKSNNNPSQSDSKSITLHPDKAVTNTDDINVSNTKEEAKQWKYPLDELKARLKKIKADEAKAKPNSDNKDNIPKKKFRDYETLKKELKELEINVTTDSDLLVTFFQEFNSHKNALATGTLSTSEVEEVLDILYNLEYLVHHIDNAKVFADMQGMSKIVSLCLNATNNEIKAEALRLLGAAVQSNPKVQLKALEHDFVQKLLRILSTNNKIEVKSRCLYALSALIRHYPAAQKSGKMCKKLPT